MVGPVAFSPKKNKERKGKSKNKAKAKMKELLVAFSLKKYQGKQMGDQENDENKEKEPCGPCVFLSQKKQGNGQYITTQLF